MDYVALFRGINVGGKHIVKMEDLRALMSDLGFSAVRTYIQSGNVLFCTDDGESSVRSKIRNGFSARFGFWDGVALRSADEMASTIALLPFSEAELAAAEAADPKVTHLYVCFLEKKADQGVSKELCREYAGQDSLQAGDRELYLLCHQSIRKSKLAAKVAKTFGPATMRNWKTVLKIDGLLHSDL